MKKAANPWLTLALCFIVMTTAVSFAGASTHEENPNSDCVLLTMEEDTVLELKTTDYFSADWVRIETTTSENVYFTIEKGNIEIMPRLNWHGYENFTVTVWYEYFGSEYPKFQDFFLQVFNVNDPPESKTPQPPVGLTADTVFQDTLDLTHMFSDVDSDLRYSWFGMNGYVTLSIDNAAEPKATITSLPNVEGEDIISVVAYDGEYYARTEVPISVFPRDNIAMNEDISQVHDFERYVFGPIYNYEFSGSDNLSVRDVQWQNETITGELSPERDWFGYDTITLIVRPRTPPLPFPPKYESNPDYGGMNSTRLNLMSEYKFEFDVVVHNVNDPPAPCLISPIQLEEDHDGTDMFNVKNLFHDIDSELIYNVASSSNNIFVDKQFNGSVDIILASDWCGIGTITASASDGEYEVSQEVRVLVSPINDPPVLKNGAPVEINEDGRCTIDFKDYLQDPDGSLSFSYLYDILALNVELDETTWTAELMPVEDWHGNTTLIIYGSDGEYVVGSAVDIKVRPVNDPPICISSDEICFNEDSSHVLNLAMAFSDIDSDLNYYAYSASGNLSLKISPGGNLTIRSSADNWHGQETAIITATDGEFSIEVPLTVEILPVNDAPAPKDAPNEIVMPEDSLTSLVLGNLFYDIENDALEYSVITPSAIKPEMEANSSVLTLRPDENWYGLSQINVTATDGKDYATIIIPLNVTPVNDAPHFKGNGEIINLESGTTTTIDMDGYFDDVDSETIMIDIQGTDALIIDYSNSGKKFNITVPSDYEGIQKIKVTATDGAEVLETEMIISVTKSAGFIESGSTGYGITLPLSISLVCLMAAVAVYLLRSTDTSFPAKSTFARKKSTG